MALTAKQRRFVIEYPIDSNGTQAAIRAGYSEATAGQIGFQLLQRTDILEGIAKREEELAAAAGVTVEGILRDWQLIKDADPSELIWIEIRCCRHCYGAGHEYEWNEWEWRKACEAAAAHRCGSKCEQPCERGNPPFPAGGLGFTPHRPPVQGCPNCKGDGEQFTKIADMRNVSPAARRLIAGVKQTKDGIEIKMRDQTDAVKNLAQFRGMMVTRGEISGPGGGAIPVASATVNLSELTDAQLLFIATRGGSVGGIIEGNSQDTLSLKQLEASSSP